MPGGRETWLFYCTASGPLLGSPVGQTYSLRSTYLTSSLSSLLCKTVTLHMSLKSHKCPLFICVVCLFKVILSPGFFSTIISMPYFFLNDLPVFLIHFLILKAQNVMNHNIPCGVSKIRNFINYGFVLYFLALFDSLYVCLYFPSGTP